MGIRHADNRLRKGFMLPKAWRLFIDNQSGAEITQADATLSMWNQDTEGILTYQDPPVSFNWTTPIADNTRVASANVVNTAKWFGAHLTLTVDTTGAGKIAVYWQGSHDAVNYPTTGWHMVHLFQGISGTAQTVNIEI